MSENKDNLNFWNSVEKTDPSKTKNAKLGAMNITAINAISQIKEATNKWGMYGSTWGLYDITREFIDVGETKLCLASAVFKYPDNNSERKFPVNSSIKVSYKTSKGHLKVDDDFMKKIDTDMTTKALSKLGFNADVFMGYYDDNKYVNQMKEEFGLKKQSTPQSEAPKTKKKVTDIAKIKTVLDSVNRNKGLKQLREQFELTEVQITELGISPEEAKGIAIIK